MNTRMGRTKHARVRKEWADWLRSYTPEKLFDSFIRSSQGAKSRCIHCHQDIYLDIVEGGGVPDWGSAMPDVDGLDYGCDASPDTNDDGVGGHEAEKRN